MEQEVLDHFHKLQLTKEEADDIVISNVAKAKFLEECSLSLFGHLLTDRHQNQRAFKNTLKTVWKMGFDLRIVEGLTTSNISLTHAPFWVQVWGLPFEYMYEDAGKDIGSRIGNVLEVDKRYERLPTFCYICGIIGHDDKHCHVSQREGVKERQYGDWLRAGSVVRSGNDKGKGLDSESLDGVDGDRTWFKPTGMAASFSSSAFSKDDEDGGWNSSSGLMGKKAVSFKALTRDTFSNLNVGDSLTGWDKVDGAARELQFGQETRFERNETNTSLVERLSKPNERAMSAAPFKNVGPCNEEPKVSSPIKVHKEALKGVSSK
nr:hypothetical protein CFP56_51438 [Quercus suber]